MERESKTDERSEDCDMYDDVEYVSCHAYYQEYDGDLGSFLASSLDMEYFISTVAATVDHVKHKLKKSKDIKLSFDEWNIWYLQEHQEEEAALAAADTAGDREALRAASTGPAAGRSGTVNQKVLPCPRVVSTPIAPPIWMTSSRQIARPSPVPP